MRSARLATARADAPPWIVSYFKRGLALAIRTHADARIAAKIVRGSKVGVVFEECPGRLEPSQAIIFSVDPKPFPKCAKIAISGVVELAVSHEFLKIFECHIDSKIPNGLLMSRGDIDP